jgi:hypothetical protein
MYRFGQFPSLPRPQTHPSLLLPATTICYPTLVSHALVMSLTIVIALAQVCTDTLFWHGQFQIPPQLRTDGSANLRALWPLVSHKHEEIKDVVYM